MSVEYKHTILVKHVMRKVSPVCESDTLRDVALYMIKEAAPVIAVVENEIVKGVIYIQDLIDPFIPDYFNYLSDFRFVKTFGYLDSEVFSGYFKSLFLAHDIMREQFDYVEPEDSILKAMFYMHRKNITGIVVIEDGKYKGIVSRFDLIGRLYGTDTD
ncbi:hypothetical protein DRN58_06065 [Thermococci archaeon]|nr:MAG: hypothetical protein DRN58_06065 [Thermococci archaeon]